ncbi:MAG: ATPase with chaperone activity [Pseudomonadota bacterium]|nr:ATPase with chaperone activity [Pseudomonadota bacterium]
MTYDHNQLVVPDSFMALFVPAGQSKPTATRAVISARYELCEDLAGQLVEHAQGQHDQGRSQEEILEAIRLGLRSGDSGIDEPESRWVVRRLAELQGWSDPGNDAGPTP